jgi:hypothetical protein
MGQSNIWCVYVCTVWRGMLDCSPAHISTQNARTHTSNFTLPHHHIDFLHFLTNFKISDFNKEYTSSLKMI